MSTQRWPFRYELTVGVDTDGAMRRIRQFERSFGLLTADESAVWSAAQVRRMYALGIGPLHLWIGGALDQRSAAWLGRN